MSLQWLQLVAWKARRGTGTICAWEAVAVLEQEASQLGERTKKSEGVVALMDVSTEAR